MASATIPAAMVTWECWKRRKLGAEWRLLGVKFTGEAFERFLIAGALYLLPVRFEISQITGYQWLQIAAVLGQAFALWKMLLWIRGRIN